jgi:DNA end-binding protein Ku
MAQQLIDSLSSDFEPDKYHDEYRERVLNLIERKAAGEEIAIQPQAEEPAAAPDLMAALEASLAAVGEDSEPEPKPSRSSDGATSKKKTAKAKAKT